MQARRTIALAVSWLAVACGPQVVVQDDGTTTAAQGTSGPDGGSVSLTADDTVPVTSVGDADATTDEPPDATGPQPSICGDGVLGPGESCDDANDEPYDGCNAECRVPGELLWQIELPGYELTGLAIGGDGVYASANTYDLVGGDENVADLHAIEPDGALRWSMQEAGLTAFEDAIESRAGGGIFVSGVQSEGEGPFQSYVRAFAPDGTLWWSYESDTSPSRPFALSRGGVTLADSVSDGVTWVLRINGNGSPWSEPSSFMGDLRGVVVTPNDDLVLWGSEGDDTLLALGKDGSVAWSTTEPEVVRGFIVDDEIELVAGYGAPRLVRYSMAGERLGDRAAPNHSIRAVPGGGYVSLADDLITRYDDALEPVWGSGEPFDIWRIDVAATRMAVGGPPPAPDGSAVPIQVGVIAL